MFRRSGAAAVLDITPQDDKHHNRLTVGQAYEYLFHNSVIYGHNKRIHIPFPIQQSTSENDTSNPQHNQHNTNPNNVANIVLYVTVTSSLIEKRQFAP